MFTAEKNCGRANMVYWCVVVSVESLSGGGDLVISGEVNEAKRWANQREDDGCAT